METWSLAHPSHGLIEIRTGFDREFRAEDPAWPGELPDRFADRPDAGEHPGGGASLSARVKSRWSNPPVRAEVRVGGAVQNQYMDLESGRIPLFGPGPKPELKPMVGIGVDRAKPHLKLTVSPFRELLHVELREGPSVVEFDPPAGSRGERRRETMESSDLKRTLIPIAEGVGKGGWALAILVLGPLVGRLLSWLASFLPDWQLPEWHPPHVDLPVPQLPHVDLPLPGWAPPSIPLPEIPDWVAFLAEYSKIWVPVVVGVAAGIIALRNHRKSEDAKSQWQHRGADGAGTGSDASPSPEA